MTKTTRGVVIADQQYVNQLVERGCEPLRGLPPPSTNVVLFNRLMATLASPRFTWVKSVERLIWRRAITRLVGALETDWVEHPRDAAVAHEDAAPRGDDGAVVVTRDGRTFTATGLGHVGQGQNVTYALGHWLRSALEREGRPLAITEIVIDPSAQPRDARASTPEVDT